MIVYEQATGNFHEGRAPTGTYGQISMRRLCETLEQCGEIQPTERITHLEIAGNLIRYRVERRTT